MSEAYFPRVMKMPAKLVQELLGHDHIEPGGADMQDAARFDGEV
jgi:hypothetical protein